VGYDGLHNPSANIQFCGHLDAVFLFGDDTIWGLNT
jgi:hypothetical protein